MKTITWNQFIELFKKPSIEFMVDNREVELFFEEDESIKITWIDNDSQLYDYYAREKDNLNIVISKDTPNSCAIHGRDENGVSVGIFDFSFYSIQPYKI